MTTHRWLVLKLEAPLAAFGGVAIDHVGITRDFPAASMLTGLIGNALGWNRTDRAAHQRLQDRLIFAARRERENPLGVLTDMQNAKLEKRDRGWTTWGEPEGRAGATYDSPHRRQRDYHADVCVSVVLRFDPTEDDPDLDAVAEALERPMRPLFLGRKPCLPSAGIYREMLLAPTAYEALRSLSHMNQGRLPLRALWPFGEGPDSGPAVHRVVNLSDQRNWLTGLHGGTRTVVEGEIVFERGTS